MIKKTKTKTKKAFNANIGNDVRKKKLLKGKIKLLKLILFDGNSLFKFKKSYDIYWWKPLLTLKVVIRKIFHKNYKQRWLILKNLTSRIKLLSFASSSQ